MGSSTSRAVTVPEPPPQDGSETWAILARWFVVCRSLEQSHTEMEKSYSNLNRIWSMLIIVVNAIATLWTNLPTQKEDPCEGESAGPGLTVFTKDFGNTLISVLTIVATGWKQYLRYDAVAEDHRQSARAFKSLLIRFEDLVQRGVPYSVAPTSDRKTGYHARSVMLGSATSLDDVKDAFKNLEVARSPSWTDWFHDFSSRMHDAPLIRPKAWDFAKSCAARSGACRAIEMQLRRLEMEATAPMEAAVPPSLSQNLEPQRSAPPLPPIGQRQQIYHSAGWRPPR